MITVLLILLFGVAWWCLLNLFGWGVTMGCRHFNWRVFLGPWSYFKWLKRKFGPKA